MKSWIAIASIAVLLGCLAAARAQSPKLDSATAQASCLIEANRMVKISSAVQGTLARVEIKRGDVVKAGQIVARLESEVEMRQLDAQRMRAQTDVIVRGKKAEFEFANQRHQRMRQLAVKDIVAQQKLEEAVMQANVAKAALDQAIFDQQIAVVEVKRLEATIERRIVRSPVDGIVSKVELSDGEYADPQIAFAVLAEISPLKIELYLPAEVYPAITAGMRMEIRPAEPFSGTFTAQIVSKDRIIDSASGLFQLTGTLPNTDLALPAGIRCTARILPGL